MKDFRNIKIEFSKNLLFSLCEILCVGLLLWTIKDIFILNCPKDKIWIDCICRLSPIVLFSSFLIVKNNTIRGYIIFGVVWICIINQQILFNTIDFGILGGDGNFSWIFIFLVLSFCVKYSGLINISYFIYILLLIISEKNFCEKINFPKTIISGHMIYATSIIKMSSTMIIISISLIIISVLINNMFKIMYHQKEQLEYVSEHDYLSQLYNRNILNKIIIDDKYQENSYIVLVDIDNFKKINDEKGHNYGDMIIQKVSRFLENHFKRESDYIIRYGGDEFLLIINSKSDIQFILDKIYKDLKNEEFSLSIGYSYYNNIDSFESVFKESDMALYNSKNNGKNQYNKFEK